MPLDIEIDFDAFEKDRAKLDLKEEIFVVESPSSDDLYFGRNEGDALARTLSLAEINITYYLATSDEMFDRAIDDIAIRVNASKRERQEWPFIHISAHGSDDGLEITDGDTIFWDKLTRKMAYLHDLVGCVKFPPEFPQDIPRINLSLSSCSAFNNYKNNLAKPFPFQMMLGPLQDVGWCQSLIAFSTFFYKAFIQKQTFPNAIQGMNAAAGDGNSPLFEACWSHDMESIMELVAKMLYTKKPSS